jgi:methionine aminopeptidase
MYAVDCDTSGVRDETSVDAKGRELIEVTRGAVAAAIAACGPQVPLATIGSVIVKYVAEVSAAVCNCRALLSSRFAAFGFCGCG